MKFITKNYFVSIALLLLVAVTSNSVYGQKVETLLSKGDIAFADQDYYSASIYYQKALSIDTVDVSIQYKYAEASRLNYEFDVADVWYTKVYGQNNSESMYPKCVFWLASVKKINEQYEDAANLFAAYAQKHKDDVSDYFVRKSLKEVESCYFAMELSENPDTTIKIVHLDSTINSELSEYAPFQIDSLLYFSSLKNLYDADTQDLSTYNKIYIANEDTTVLWNTVEEGDIMFNLNNFHNANVSFNEDKTKMFLTRCFQQKTRDFVCEIYASEKIDGYWTTPAKLPENINLSGFTNTQPSVGFMGEDEVLFFASDRLGGVGGMDIWYSKIDADGNYGKPVNAGLEINSMEDDITPFYCNTCQELFFSSTWHNGLGGFDIFKSEYSNGVFLEPMNLEAPINTPHNDIYFTLSDDKTQAYLSSNREGSFFEVQETCCNDIYMFDIPYEEPEISEEEKARLLAEESYSDEAKQLSKEISELKQPIAVFFHNDSPGAHSIKTSTDVNYKDNYAGYSMMRAKYMNEYARTTSGADRIAAKKAIDDFFTDSVDVGMYDLEVYAEYVLKVLKAGQSITIKMQVYCSPLGNAAYNLSLAKRRMTCLNNYFAEYEGGVFIPYFSNNVEGLTVTIIQEFFGESMSNPLVNTDLFDPRNSVFSPDAASERKVRLYLNVD